MIVFLSIGLNSFMLCKFVTNAYDDMDVTFWNEIEDVVHKHEQKPIVLPTIPPTIITHISGHQFSNLTNFNITFSISDPTIVASILHNMQG
jgi:hypothetical protein